MKKELMKRLEQLERLLEQDEPFKPTPIVFPDVNGGLTCRDVHYDTEEDVKAAFPDADLIVFVQVVDGRKPHKEVVSNA
ncbi:hypothetical protein [Solidesulfovibrio sp.]|uniref:hypothetical protein n=1 Tax=Solidesulfovibrio sp. TaxID=2910990 RepID=UPI002B2146A9|nr:hypothetical protein [Solidesulfovibrio sp.]MEA4856061.1 hypothetical protein [Solidesulfovibrio sp.]